MKKADKPKLLGGPARFGEIKEDEMVYKIKKVVIEVEPGTEVLEASQKAVEISRSFNGCQTEFEFNGIGVVYDGKSEATRLTEFYHKELNKRTRKGGEMNKGQINKKEKEIRSYIGALLKSRRGLEQQMEAMGKKANPAKYSKLLKRAARIGGEIAKSELNLKQCASIPALTPYRAPKLQGRNEKCACGSGKKFKKCCLDKATAPIRHALINNGRGE